MTKSFARKIRPGQRRNMSIRIILELELRCWWRRIGGACSIRRAGPFETQGKQAPPLQRQGTATPPEQRQGTSTWVEQVPPVGRYGMATRGRILNRARQL